MKAFYGILMIFVLCSMCYISVDSNVILNVKCNQTSQCTAPCKIKRNTPNHKCINGLCHCYNLMLILKM
nr:putative KTx Tcis11 [Tityus cisandinus]